MCHSSHVMWNSEKRDRNTGSKVLVDEQWKCELTTGKHKINQNNIQHNGWFELFFICFSLSLSSLAFTLSFFSYLYKRWQEMKITFNVVLNRVHSQNSASHWHIHYLWICLILYTNSAEYESRWWDFSMIAHVLCACVILWPSVVQNISFQPHATLKNSTNVASKLNRN